MKKQFISHTKHKVMITCKRLTALMLTLLLFIMTIPSAIALGNEPPILPDSDIPETLTRSQLEAHGAVARLRAEEPDEFTFVYLNEDGTRTSYSYGVAVKYEENGEYVDKDNTIKDFNNEYGNTASDVELRFPKHLNKISIKYKNHNIKIKPVTDIPAGHINASVSGNTVTYPNAFGQGMDLRYSSTMSGMKEDIILQSYQGVNTFSFEVETAGLELKQSGGQYVIADGDEVIFSFGDLEVTDSFTGENEATDNWDEHITLAQGNIQTVKENKKYIFTITVPEEFLTADTTVYPVYVDPSFNVTSNYIQDTFISEGNPNTNYGTGSQMKIGYGSSTQRNRILVQFSSFVGGESRPGLTYSTVNSVYYHMYCTSTYTSQPYVDAYMISLGAQTWTETGATWNNAYSSTSTNAVLNGSTTVGSAGWYSFDITNAYVTWWQAFTYRGLMFRMRDEGSSPNYYRHFASANNSDSTKIPYMRTNYGTVDIPVMQINRLNNDYGYMEIGETKQLALLTNLSSSEIVWSSSNTTVATVQNGLITARAAGYATITVSCAYDDTVFDTYALQVVAVPVTSVAFNDTTIYINKGDNLTAMYSVSPSNATVKDVTWSSNNLSVATVDTNGLITARAAGEATITVRTKQGNKTDTITVIVPEFEDGEYYLKNKATGRYADVEGPTNNSGAIIHQWDYHGYASQQWEFTLLSDGYYKIKSMHSNLYLSVQNNSSEQDAPIIQSAYTGAIGQQWKLQLFDNGHYTLTPKCGESVDRVLASATYLTNNNGIDVQQRLYIDDTNYKDEWDVFRPNYIAYVNGYYDNGFLVRYGEDALENLEKYQNKTGQILLETFKLRIIFSELQYYQTLPDICKGTVTINNINEMCTNPNHVYTTEVRNENTYNCYCTSRASYFSEFVAPDSADVPNVLWSGHKVESRATSGNTNYNRSGVLGNTILMLGNDGSNLALLHELIHKFSGRVNSDGEMVGIDHYHEPAVTGDDSTCKFKDICSKCNEGKPGARPYGCVMQKTDQDINNINIQDIICVYCQNDTMAYLEEYYTTNQIAEVDFSSDESDAQIYEEEPPTNHQMYFDKSSEIKWWLATAEGAERYKSFEYINHDYIVDPYQVEKGMIDHLINKVREDGMPVPYINGKDASYNWWIQIPGTRLDASVYYKVDINNHMYLIQMTHIDKENLQYAQEGYDAYQTVMGEFRGYTPTAFTIGQTEYNGAFNKDDSYDTIYFYAIIDGWDVRIRGNQGVTQEEILNDLTQLEFKTEAVPSVILIIIIIIAAAIAVATAVILLKRKKKKVPTE